MAEFSETEPSREARDASFRKKRLLLIAVLGLLALGTTGLYLRLTFMPSVGSGPAGPRVSKTPFTAPWIKRPVLFVGLGDSVTAGFGARKGYSYFERLRVNPPEESDDLKSICLSAVFPKLTSTNLAVSGSTSFELLESQLPLLPQAGGETLGWVVITTGGNDLIHNYGRTPPRAQAMYGATWAQATPWIKAFGARLEAIINGVTSRFPGGCQIFLANIYDPSDGMGDIEKAGLPHWPDGARILAAYNETIAHGVAQHPNVHLVNVHDLFLGHGIHCGQFWSKHYDRHDPRYWYYTNLEDPNERGYDALRRLFLNEMASVMRTEVPVQR